MRGPPEKRAVPTDPIEIGMKHLKHPPLSPLRHCYIVSIIILTCSNGLLTVF